MYWISLTILFCKLHTPGGFAFRVSKGLLLAVNFIHFLFIGSKVTNSQALFNKPDVLEFSLVELAKDKYMHSTSNSVLIPSHTLYDPFRLFSSTYAGVPTMLLSL